MKAVEVQEGAFDTGDSGLWMRRHWLHDGPAQTEIDALAQSLRAHGIRRLYPFLGPMDREGWPGWRSKACDVRYRPDLAKLYFSGMQTAAPGIRILPWTGGVVDRDVRLQDVKQRELFADHAKRLAALGADGIHINIEPLPARTPGYLDLLRAVKAALGPHRLSVAAYPPPTPQQTDGDLQWDRGFLREVCGIADEIVIMGYNTGASSPVLYKEIVTSWMKELAAALPGPSSKGCEWLMGVPAYDDSDEDHRPDVETIENSLNAIVAALATEGRPKNFAGLAIYASFTMNGKKWAAFDRLWRGKAPVAAPLPDF